MHDPRFVALRERLVRAGVAARYAHRAATEMAGHYEALRDAAVARGATLDEARTAAHAAMGTDAELERRYTQRPELRSLAARRPGWCFGVLPLASFLGVVAALAAISILFQAPLHAYLERTTIPPALTARIDRGATLLLLWLTPLAIGGAYAVWAYRQRIDARWPAAGITLLCVLASLVDVSLILHGGPDPGELRAGLGVSGTTWPGQAAQAIARAGLVLAPFFWAVRRQRHPPPLAVSPPGVS